MQDDYVVYFNIYINRIYDIFQQLADAEIFIQGTFPIQTTAEEDNSLKARPYRRPRRNIM